MDKKILQAITEIKDGKMLAIASSEEKDRVGDVLNVDNWDFKNFKKNPVLQAGHDYRPQFTIGIAKNLVVEGKKVLFEPVFHTITDLARQIKEMYEQGFLKAWSVGYIPGETNELLEISAVAVPANASALVIAKGMNPEQEIEVKKQIDEFIVKEVEPEKHDDIIIKVEPKEGDVCTLADGTEGILELNSDGKLECKSPKKEKSPMCRMSDETEKECVARKIPEIMNEDSTIKQDQAVAMAISMCGKSCDEKKEDKKEITIEEIEIKEGRVISTKNKKIINDAITASKDAVSALENLLTLSEPVSTEKEVEVVKTEEVKTEEKVLVELPKKAEGEDTKKGRDPRVAHKQLSKGELAVQVLKEIAKNSAFALNQLKK
jgi:hypothetical protein